MAGPRRGGVVFVTAAWLLAASFLFVGGCGQLSSEKYRYRLTVEVETPQGVRTGSSVIEVANWKGMGFPGPEAGGIGTAVRGEAVAVDIAPSQTLFALLSAPGGSADHAAGMAFDALMPSRIDKGGDPDAFLHNVRLLRDIRAPGTLPPERYPQFVRFSDINDPRTIEAVDPGNLGASFGPGVRLRRIIVQVTDDPVTTGIEKRLKWLPQQNGALLKVPLNDRPSLGTALPFAASITEGDFWKEIKP